jgi:hypothetical protein
VSFLQFALTSSALLAGLVVVAAWTWRASSAPLAAKIALPALMLVAALYLPWTFAAMLGRPVPTSANRLPDGARLIALQMFDGDTRAQLWLSEGGSTRLYEIAVGEREKQALRRAREGQHGGGRVTVQTGGKGKPNGMYATGSDGFGVQVQAKEPDKTGE